MVFRRKRVRSRGRPRRRSRSRSRRRRTAVATKAWVNKTVRDRGVAYSVHSDVDWQPASLNMAQLGSNILPGDDIGHKDGDQIFYKGVNIKMIARNLSVTMMRYIRCIVIQEKNNAQMPLLDLFQTITATQTPIDWIAGQSMQLIESINKQKHTVLYDRLWKVKPNLNETGHDNALIKNVYIPINKKFSYNSDGSTMVSITPNIWILFWVSDNNNSVTFLANTMALAVRYREYFNK